MNFKMNWKEEFKYDLYDRISRDLEWMNPEAEWDLYLNNAKLFKYFYDEYEEVEHYSLWDLKIYKTDDLIHIGKEILERSGKPYTIIKWHKGALIFEGYENLRHGEYLKRKRELGI